MLGLVLVALGDVAEQLAVAVGLPVIEVAQHERRAGDRERLVDRARERSAGIDDVDGAEPEPLIDLVLVAELRGRKYADLIAAVGALLDLLGRPQRLGVIGLRHFIDMRPFELGLRAGGSPHSKCCDHERETERELMPPRAHDHFSHVGGVLFSPACEPNFTPPNHCAVPSMLRSDEKSALSAQS